MSTSTALWSSQPFKTIFVACFLLTTPVHLMILCAKYAVRSSRPVPAWTIKYNVLAALTKKLFYFWTVTKAHFANHTAPQEAKERHTRVAPPSSTLFQGPLVESQLIRPAPVDAVWFPRPPSIDASELAKQKCVIHFPGGAFVLAFSHQKNGKPITGMLNKHFQADTSVWAQYRLATSSEERFPAAVQDAVTFYNYVLSLGFDPKNVIVSGDSAGGNIALALARYLQDGQTELPLPRGVAVFSPWVHVTATAARDFEDSLTSRSDVLDGSVLQWGADAYRPHGVLSPDVEAYISPLHHPFRLSVPLFVHAGTVEGFYDQIAEFVTEMTDIGGNRVVFRATELAPHNLLFTHEAFGKTKELEECLEKAHELFEKAA